MDGVACVLTAADLPSTRRRSASSSATSPSSPRTSSATRGEPVAVVAAETLRAGAPGGRLARRRLRAAAGGDGHGAGAAARMRRASTTSATSSATCTSTTAIPRARSTRTCGSRATTRPRCRTRPRSARKAASPSRPPTAASTCTSVTQWIHIDRQQIAPCLGLPEEKVRITLAGVGGAFGSREDMHDADPRVPARAAARTAPVKMVVRPRGVVPRARPPASVAHVDPPTARPATAGSSPATLRLLHGRRRVCVVVAGGHRQRVDVRRRARTRCRTCASRGRSSTRTTRRAARCAASARRRSASRTRRRWTSSPQKLGIDPIELRLRNALHDRLGPADRARCSTGTAPRARGDRALPRDPAAARSPRRGPRRDRVPGRRRQRQPRRVAASAASASRSASRTSRTARASTTPPRRRSRSARRRTGPVASIRTAAVDYGQGLYTVLAQIVRTELGVEQVAARAVDDRASARPARRPPRGRRR